MGLVILLFVALVCLVVIAISRRGSNDKTNQAAWLESIKARAAEQSAQKQDALSSTPFKNWKWKTIAFLDVETTGLTAHDRVVTLAAVLVNVPAVKDGEAKLDLVISAIHRIYNPGRKCNPVALSIHGHNDWELRHQPNFVEEAAEVAEFLGRADLIVCHNADFDLRFINHEFAKASMPPLGTPSFCTMQGYRRKYSGSASLDNVVRQLGLKREGGEHGALEDAWLTLNVFFALQGAPTGFPFSALSEEQRKLQNLRDVPPMSDGDHPPPKRVPHHSNTATVPTRSLPTSPQSRL